MLLKLLFKNHFAYTNSQIDGLLHVTYYNSQLYTTSQVSFIAIYKLSVLFETKFDMGMADLSPMPPNSSPRAFNFHRPQNSNFVYKNNCILFINGTCHILD